MYVDLLKLQLIITPFTGDSNNSLEGQNSESVKLMLSMWHNNQRTCDLMLQEEQIQNLIHATNLLFDLLLVEAFFNECFFGFVHKFKSTLIQLCVIG
jgi:hypothetical protein